METIFKKLGFTVSACRKSNEDIAVDLLLINNPDGTPRWIWNTHCQQALFLKFYNMGSLRAFIFANLIKIVFVLKLQRWAFHKRSFFFSKETTNPVFDCTGDWALFTGTVGPNNKAILYANASFYKIATTVNAQKLIDKECSILQYLESKTTSFNIPKASIISTDVIELSDVSNHGVRTKKIAPVHLKALREINTFLATEVEVGNWTLFQKAREDFRTINDTRIPKNLVRKMEVIIDAIPAREKVSLSLSQGDFTQWNMFENNGTIALYDWELASFEKPKGFDYFHFIIQQGVLVERKSWKSIYDDIIKSSEITPEIQLFDNDRKQLDSYLKWYLLVNCMHYLKVYSDQPHWHVQIDWLLQVWNEGLNVFIQEEKTPRQLVIMDLFDFLQNKEYAALKFINGFPEGLSINSDIDLVVKKETNESLVQFLGKHTLVSKITLNRKSFMNTIQVFMHDGSLLSIDLLWQLKRRNLEIMDAKKLIVNKCLSYYGVKQVSSLDIARYVVLFYVLNEARIPKKYLVYEELIRNSKEPLDLILEDYFICKKKGKSILLNCIKKNKENRSFSYLKNSFCYCMDTIRQIVNSRGFTITFSGVDGSGKSTVIENVALRIEKQLRKPVVVLRHRPSVLPILSVWSKGKKQAHKAVMESLPREGKNTSALSSVLRFSYYYTDYLIGQFVVYFKYIIRGYVVIYDRYYFDFINDSKRSNLVLPKRILTFGYQFLLKPKFNFFLFADANVILMRKQELSKMTIEKLTQEYQNLFQTLKAKSQSSVYESIHNEELELTLDRVVKTIIQSS